MITPRLVLCSGISIPSDDARRVGRRVVELDSIGPDANVNVQIEDVAKVFMRHLPSRQVDLIEVASYIFTADAATRRGTEWADDYATEPWGRDFHLIIPVRDLPFWQRNEVQKTLTDALNFLSDDRYTLEFVALEKERPVQNYLALSDEEDWRFYGAERVVMFSGGLDSLAGAVDMAGNGENLVLVSHRPISTISARQRKLFAKLRETFSVQMIHVPVWINKDLNFGREPTQRTRSFLYSAIGTVVAESVRAEGVRFFENGIVSLNLPIADEVVRARASRTTHPQALYLLSRFYSLVTERDFAIDNPYLFKTKAEVIDRIVSRNAAHLIPYTSSCAHTAFQSKNQWHCGTCSQCIDRRIAILAAGQQANDPGTDYVSDVFMGPRKEGPQKNMAVNYARHATELHLMDPEEIASQFNLEITRAARYFDKRREIAQQIVEMHKRHGETVFRVLEQQLRENSSKLVEGTLNPSSLLTIVAGQQHREPIWRTYGARIIQLLQAGLPVACKTHKPKDEPHLQEICDGILKAEDHQLLREFPYMRWSVSLTKPDFSCEPFRLWVELKYVRKREDIRPITEDIAADITKYGDNQRRVLFVVYDPQHLIVDEQSFAEQIVQRRAMSVHFIR